MCHLYKFLKRQSPDLFNSQFGMAARINEHYTKFLCNKYGEVRHMYLPQTEWPVIEADIKRLLQEEFDQRKFH